MLHSRRFITAERENSFQRSSLHCTVVEFREPWHQLLCTRGFFSWSSMKSSSLESWELLFFFSLLVNCCQPCKTHWMVFVPATSRSLTLISPFYHQPYNINLKMLKLCRFFRNKPYISLSFSIHPALYFFLRKKQTNNKYLHLCRLQ